MRPVSMGPFRKRPCTERGDAPLPARRPTEAYPRGTVREGNEAGVDAAALECRDLREWVPGGRCAAVQGYRTASHERSPPPTKSPGAAVYRCGWGRRRSRRRRGGLNGGERILGTSPIVTGPRSGSAAGRTRRCRPRSRPRSAGRTCGNTPARWATVPPSPSRYTPAPGTREGIPRTCRR